jgi:ribosomal protein L14
VTGLPSIEMEWMSKWEVSRHNKLQLDDVICTVYFALARKRHLMKSTEAVHERCVRRASLGLEREEGSSESGIDDDLTAVVICHLMMLTRAQKIVGCVAGKILRPTRAPFSTTSPWRIDCA